MKDCRRITSGLLLVAALGLTGCQCCLFRRAPCPPPRVPVAPGVTAVPFPGGGVAPAPVPGVAPPQPFPQGPPSGPAPPGPLPPGPLPPAPAPPGSGPGGLPSDLPPPPGPTQLPPSSSMRPPVSGWQPAPDARIPAAPNPRGSVELGTPQPDGANRRPELRVYPDENPDPLKGPVKELPPQNQATPPPVRTPEERNPPPATKEPPLQPPPANEPPPAGGQPYSAERPPDSGGKPGDFDSSPFPVGIPEFSMATRAVSSGLRPMLDGLDWLQANKYRAVLHLKAPGADDSADRKQVELRGMKYLSLEVSADTLSPQTVAEFSRLVSDPQNHPLFVYDGDGSLVGGLWYLHFRETEGLDADVARVRASALGLREDRGESHRLMWLAIQNYLQRSRGGW